MNGITDSRYSIAFGQALSQRLIIRLVEKARRKQAKEALKGSTISGRPSGPANGAINVPGNYVVDAGTVKKKYWELVCDKLNAVQAARNLQRSSATADELQDAERTVQEARKRIYEAEVKFEREASMA